MSGDAEPQAPRGRVRDVVRLAWPAAASYLLNNAYRINDQFWVQGLGGAAQEAIGATLYILIFNASIIFLAAAGTLALKSRAVGARDEERASAVTSHAIALALGIGVALTTAGSLFSDDLCHLLGLDAEQHVHGAAYLGTIFLWMVPLCMAVVLDQLFLGRGNTIVPMLLQVSSVLLNAVLNPILIYGTRAPEALAGAGGEGPVARAIGGLADFAAAAAETLGIEGAGLSGAATATGLSRAIPVTIGFGILFWRYPLRLLRPGELRLRTFGRLVKISLPVSSAIALYGGTYIAIVRLVLQPLPAEVKGGLGIGFQVFEGVAFPMFLGVSVAAASLVGRSLGAGDAAGARDVVRSARRVGLTVGATMSVLFVVGAELVAPKFTMDADVLREAVRYVHILAVSQLIVASQAVDERVLIGAGYTRPILFITGSGDLLRIPFGYWTAVTLGWGAAGVWWTINASTLYKAILLRRVVRKGDWLAEP